MAWIARAVNVFRRNRLLRHLDDELAFHVAERIDELVAGGMTPDDATTEALRRFGGYTRQRERTRDMNIVAWLEALVADVRYGARQLWGHPGFTTVAVLSLALGIGANTAIFQMINALRLRSLPAVEAPAELAVLARGTDFFTFGWYSSRHQAFTYAQFQAVRQAQDAFSDMLVFGPTSFNVSPSGEAHRVEGLWVNSNFLDVLGVRPILGSGFVRVKDEADCSQAGAVLSYASWQRQYRGNPACSARSCTCRVARDLRRHGATQLPS
ncbi:MAG: ABC transporter permease [Acidobacteria bacterium]|nr:ABC transporter permease [Acidobacteriota bacterium]